MLSNPTKALHNRQRQHRRQNSTPTAFEPVKANNLPDIQRHGTHRRGMSLDQRRQPSSPQDVTVSNTNNQGYQTTQQQHILRETQQQRLVRPGHHFRLDNDENYLNSPAVTPHRQSFDAGCINYVDQINAQFGYTGPINPLNYVDPHSFSGANDFGIFAPGGAMTPSAFLNFSAEFDNSNNPSNDGSRRSSSGRRISGGIMDRVSQFENMAIQSPLRQRPITPPNQNVTSYFPPTPIGTPQDRMIKQEQMNQRFLDSYDTSMEETIKPKSNQRARGVFEDMRREAEMNAIQPIPSQARNIIVQTSFDSAPMPTANFMNMSNLNLEFMKNEPQYPQFSPVAADPSSAVSYSSSPDISQRTIKGNPFANTPAMEPAYNEPQPATRHLVSPSPLSQASHRRSESICSINLDESQTETGITLDDIANFIQGPDPHDGKWVCLFPECGKRFGRKENIKSHVQTHLGDRQFQCPHCKKCFVRQHDLKRHAKIHSGVKPYPCQCGNSFARHDALTRHRQRGMCIGAFGGVVKKTAKRGRPRKNRPDDEKRLTKSSRTRNKNKGMSSGSSTGGTESTSGNSPRSEIDILDDKLFGNYRYGQTSKPSQEADKATLEYLQPQSPNSAECISPQDTQNPSSPAANSVHSTYSRHQSFSDNLPSSPQSPARSQHSQYHSPPGLCESSSSPAPSHTYYDIDNSSNHGEAMPSLSLANISEHDDEMFLEAFAAAGSNGLSQLERDPEMLLSKFDDSFNASGGEDMFKNEADVFFGSP
ncbi:hypothetical protein HYALB_00013077 [Hymenoscyphus albidus]|uniref:C2H2-type domain-containing protein n=1 Tax=Hymenoscyphus albidus TaxID=595503 RepID=A0A9N9LU28_9HELO|nr:hypothetical protein HYALB_00013077 [Hymenoscyphus albidus]